MRNATPAGGPADPAYEKRLADFVEEFAVVLQGRGLPRMAGRIFARLLVCEPPEQTGSQLAANLRASRGTISDMTRLLLQGDLIERVSRAGERESYYRVGPGNATRFLNAALGPLRTRRLAAERGLEVMKDRPAGARARLEELRDVYRISEEVYPEILERWARRQQERERAGGST